MVDLEVALAAHVADDEATGVNRAVNALFGARSSQLHAVITHPDVAVTGLSCAS